jgi:hypothetical protein
MKLALEAKELSAVPCPRCRPLAETRKIRAEMVQPLPEGALAPLAQDGSGKCCYDCASADTLLRLKMAPDFVSARIATGTDREDSHRRPGVPMGLVKAGLVRPSKPGDFEQHLAWLDQHSWFGQRPDEEEDR